MFYHHAHPVGLLLRGSPKLNGHVERAQRTHTEEFYEVTEASFEIGELNQALLEWEKVYPSKKDYPTSSSSGIPYSTGVSGTISAKKKRGNVSLII